MARYLAAKDKHDRFNVSATPFREKAEAVMPSYTITHKPKLGVPATFRIGPDDFAEYDPEPDGWDTYKFIRPEIEKLKADHQEYLRIKKEVRYNELAETSDRYCDEMTAAESVLLNMPAPHLKAVEWKLAYWMEISKGGSVDPENFATLLSDVRRLAGRAAA